MHSKYFIIICIFSTFKICTGTRVTVHVSGLLINVRASNVTTGYSTRI